MGLMVGAADYDPAAMPASPLKPDSSPAGPKICTCGYDLTGLPDAGDTKCPECGELLSGLTRRDSPHMHNWQLCTIAMMPSVVLMLGFVPSLFLASDFVILALFNLAIIIALIYLVLISFPACIMVVKGIEPKMPLGKRVAYVLLGFLLCVMLNVGVFMVFVLMLRELGA
jgi:hypothetical protein